MTEPADAVREQGVYLLNPLPGGGYRRPYPTKIIEVSFMTQLPVYAGANAVVNSGFLDPGPGNSGFKEFDDRQITTIEKLFKAIEKIADVKFVFTATPGTGAI